MFRSVIRRRCLGVCLPLLATASGCHGPAESAPAVVRVSALPDQAPERVLAQHQAVVDQVCAIARLSCRWVPAQSYVEQLGQGAPGRTTRVQLLATRVREMLDGRGGASDHGRDG